MTVGQALRRAARDFYENSLRLLVLNTALSAAAVAILILGFYTPLAFVLLLVLGPLAAALMHCAVTVAQGDDLRFADALVGLRLHWRRGLVLALIAATFVVLTVVAVGFYGGRGALAWPLAILVLYIGGLFGVFQLALWPIAVFQRERPLRTVFRDAAAVAARRPGASVGFAIALLLINVIGFVAALLPFLMITIAYSFLAAAHFSLPPSALSDHPS